MPYMPRQFEAIIPPLEQLNGHEKAKIVVVGAGPIGLALALDLGLRGHQVVVITRNTSLSEGSRALCYAKRPLEVLDRLGIAEKMLDKGVSWNVGRVFFKQRKDPVYSFDLLPIRDQKMPAMINIQQYYNEEYSIEALAELDNVEIRWGNELVDLEQTGQQILAKVVSQSGGYTIMADWLVACDGSSSPTRKMLKLNFEGETFQDNFLIADVKFEKEYPTERHFWFDPPFNPGQSVLLHKQPDNVWRIDFQIGWEIDRAEVVKPENVAPRIKAIFGDDIVFTFEWISVYTFNCRQIEKMVDDRVIFAGDSAHLVSPFGARGANTGFQDIDNLGWKLSLIIQGKAKKDLLESYNEERLLAAEVNILNSTRSTDFITPKSKVSTQFRDAVLQLSTTHEFARGFVNSGRLSTPVPYPDSSLNTPDYDQWKGGISPGFNCLDAPVKLNHSDGWLLNQLGWDFCLLVISPLYHEFNRQEINNEIEKIRTVTLKIVWVCDKKNLDDEVLIDERQLVAKRYGCQQGGIYLIRPDQYVAARWKKFDPKKIHIALNRSLGVRDNEPK